MSEFILAMSLRYFFVTIGLMILAAVIEYVLVANGIVDGLGHGKAIGVLMGAGAWAGTYFRKRSGRTAEWAECWRIGAVLTVLHEVAGLLFFSLFSALGFSPFKEMPDAGTIALAIMFMVLTFGIYVAATASMIHITSKPPRRFRTN